MKAEHILVAVVFMFSVIGLIFMNNLAELEALPANAAVVGFVVGEEAVQSQGSNNGIISGINGFFTKGIFTPEQRDKYLPIYILLNILFIATVVSVYYKFKKR